MPADPSSGAAPRARARRAGRRAVLAALLLVVALSLTLLGAALAVARDPATVATVDPALLTRIGPPPGDVPGDGAVAARTGAPESTRAAVVVEMPDFPAPEASFGPRPAPELAADAKVLKITPPPTPPPAPRAKKPARTTASNGGRTSSRTTTRTTTRTTRTTTRSAPRRAGQSVSGTATWYCKPGVSACHRDYPGGMYAAAGPALRVGSWRGRAVTVCTGGRCVNVRLIDWCACPGGRVIDLYSEPFSRLGSLSQGTLRVTVSW